MMGRIARLCIKVYMYCVVGSLALLQTAEWQKESKRVPSPPLLELHTCQADRYMEIPNVLMT